jgi:hypothetical protein
MATNLFEYYQEQGQALPSVQERSSTYESLGLGSADSYVGSAEQNTQFLQTLQSGGTATQEPTFQVFEPAPIPTDSLNQTVQQLPDPNQIQQQPVQSFEELTRDFQTQTSPQQQQLEQQQSGLLDELEGLISQSGEESQRLTELEGELGVNDIQRNIGELDKQIMGLVNQAKQAEVTSQGRQASGFAIKGEQAQIARQLQAQTFGLAAAKAAMQGDLALAQQRVQRALDAEFGALRADIEAKKFLLDNVRADLSEEQEQRAQIFEAKLADREAQIAQEQQSKEDIYNLLVEASSLGTVPPAVLSQAQSAQTREQALQILSPYIGEQATSGGTSGGGGISSESMSTNQIEQFRRSYGWTPPFGFSESQLIQFMEDNPGLTADEYQALANQAAGQDGTQAPTTSSGGEQGPLTYQSIFDAAKDAQRAGFDSEEIIDELIDIYGLDTLHAIAKEQGIASAFTPKEMDVKRMLNAIL